MCGRTDGVDDVVEEVIWVGWLAFASADDVFEATETSCDCVDIAVADCGCGGYFLKKFKSCGGSVWARRMCCCIAESRAMTAAMMMFRSVGSQITGWVSGEDEESEVDQW